MAISVENKLISSSQCYYALPVAKLSIKMYIMNIIYADNAIMPKLAIFTTNYIFFINTKGIIIGIKIKDKY